MFELIHLHHASSRAEIATALELTPAAVGYIVAELLEAGLIRESGRRSGARGQPAIELGIRADAAWTIGLHLDHRRVSGCVADLGGHVAACRHRTLPGDVTAAQVRRALLEVAEALLAVTPGSRPLGIGLAAVGPLDPARNAVLETPRTRRWGNEPLREPLADALGLDVRMENNVTAAAIGEYWHGHGRAFRNFLVIGFFSAGLGGGLFLQRRVYRGSGPNAAEFGHMLVSDPGGGHAVHLETLASPEALQRDLGTLSPEQIDTRLAEGDDALEHWLQAAAAALAQAITSVDHLLDLDAIILTGQLPPTLFEALIERIAALREPLYMQGWHRRPELLLGRAGADAVLLGAASLPVYDALVPARHERDLATSSARSAGLGAG